MVADKQAATDIMVSHFVRKCRDFSGNHTTMNISMQISMIFSVELKNDVRYPALNSLQVKLFTNFRAIMSTGDSSPNSLILNVLDSKENVSAMAKDMISILCGLNLVCDSSVTASVIPFPNSPTTKKIHASVTMV